MPTRQDGVENSPWQGLLCSHIQGIIHNWRQYETKKHQRKRPIQKTNPNFQNYFESSICILIFSIGNELLQVKCVTVKIKTTCDTYVMSGWSFIYLKISQVRIYFKFSTKALNNLNNLSIKIRYTTKLIRNKKANLFYHRVQGNTIPHY